MKAGGSALSKIKPQESLRMKTGTLLSFSMAAGCLALLLPQHAWSRSWSGSRNSLTAESTSNSTDNQQATQEAAWMVPAKVHLLKSLDARKTQTGSQFEAVLDGTVNLKGGTTLPHGTVLMGEVVTDQMQTSGTSRLALRFTQAKLKNGTVIPIRAMIAGISGPANSEGYANDNPGPPTWNSQTLQVDEIGVLSHVDLHSRVVSPDSGVLVSTRGDDMKIKAGSQMTLAIGKRNSGSTSMNGGA
jgi:hypothetical protein